MFNLKKTSALGLLSGISSVICLYFGQPAYTQSSSPNTVTLYTVVIDGSSKPGKTQYTINNSGQIIPSKGEVAGHSVSIQPNDRVSDNTAIGHVRGGADGFYIISKGSEPEIQLNDPNAATVYLDGKEVSQIHTVVIDGGDKSGETEYTINSSGQIMQLAGELVDRSVSIQPNDRVSDNTAQGQVSNGADGFLVTGNVPEIQLNDPNAATVYVNGKKLNSRGN